MKEFLQDSAVSCCRRTARRCASHLSCYKQTKVEAQCDKLTTAQVHRSQIADTLRSAGAGWLHDAPQIRNIALKVSSVQLLLLDTAYTSITFCYWPAVTTPLSSAVSEILSLFQCLRLVVTLRSSSPLTTKFKSQTACAFQFMRHGT